MELDALLAAFPAPVQETARRVVAIARALLPDAVESCEGGDYGIGVGPGRGAVHRHVKLAGVDDAAAPALRELMARAAAARR